MTEYIDRKDIIKWIDDSLEKCGHRYSNDMITMMEMFRTVINDCIPAADVRPVVRGKWVKKTRIDLKWDYKQAYYVCSECGADRMLRQHNFCPNCGAEMKEES